MEYWFTNPMVKSLLPLASSTSIRGLSSSFTTPAIFMGPNALPEGPGAMGASGVDLIAAKCPEKRAFIVTDEHGVKSSAKVARSFEASGFTTTTWAKAVPEAPLDSVQESAVAMKEFKPDLIIAVGGGSVMDGAKAAWILYEAEDDIDLAMILPMSPLGLRKKAIYAAVPTTSGTGSECTSVAVVHDTEAHRKIPIANPELLPDFAFLIPEFTVSMPPALTAGTGLDALAHAIDCVPTAVSSEITDALALAAIQMVFKYLPRAYKNGNDMEARFRMIVAASTAGIAFGQGGVGLTHSFGHSLGSLFNVHHGVAVGLFIPYVFQFYKVVTDKHKLICHALHIGGDSDEETLANLIGEIKGLFGKLDVPTTISGLGISEADFEKNMEKLVLYTMEDISTFFSPRPMTAAQCEQIFRNAYEGKDIDF